MTQNLPATISDEYGSGYEDLDDEIQAVPRIQIVHKSGVFKDSLSGEEFAEIVGVPLGVVKQRIFWPSDMGETPSKPFCKSNDAKTGYPNEDAEKDGGFPWSDAAGLDPNTQPKDEFGRTVISCETCPFAQWGTDPKNPKKSVPPPCKERHTYPIIYNRTGGEGYEPPYMESGIVSFQGSGIKPSRLYVAGFKRAKLPLYTGVVRIKLNRASRGAVDYSVPEFKRVGTVPDDELVMYAQDWPGMREFLTKPPRANDDGSDPARGHGQTAAQAAAAAGASMVQNASVTTASDASVVEAEVLEEPVAAPVSAPANIVNQAAKAPSAAPAPDDDELPF